MPQPFYLHFIGHEMEKVTPFSYCIIERTAVFILSFFVVVFIISYTVYGNKMYHLTEFVMNVFKGKGVGQA